MWAKLSNNSILTDKGRNLFPKNLPGHRIISWKSEDESHVIEDFACNSTSWKSSAKSWVFKGFFELFVGEPETHFYSENKKDRLLLKLNTHSQRFVWMTCCFSVFREKTRSFSKIYFLEISIPGTKIKSFVSLSLRISRSFFVIRECARNFSNFRESPAILHRSRGFLRLIWPHVTANNINWQIGGHIVCYTAVFSVVTQRFSPQKNKIK